MKVFISWSGDISHEVAMALHDWLPSVIQLLKPYVSSEDIAKGTRWSGDISEELENSLFGILCVTKDNLNAPWLNFEAGALSISVEKSRVAPFLFGIELSEIKEGPLSQFQATTFDKADIKKLLGSLNTAGAAPLLREDLLNDAFDTLWPRLEAKLNEIRDSEPEAKEGAPSSQGKGTDTSLHEVKNLVAEGVAEGVAKGVAEGLKKFAEINAEAVSKNPEESGEIAERVRRDPATPPIDRAIAAAVLLQQEGKIEEAIEKWRSIANVAGEENRQIRARAWFSIGYLFQIRKEEGDLKAAIDAYTTAIKLEPVLAEAYNNRGNAKGDLGRSVAAIADYTCAIKLNPNYAAAYNNRGAVNKSLNRHEAAIADYTCAIKLNPNFTEAYDNRGASENALGRHEAAITDHTHAIELNPASAKAYYNRGTAKVRLDRINEAREDYQQAKSLAQASGDKEVFTAAKHVLSLLDTDAVP